MCVKSTLIVWTFLPALLVSFVLQVLSMLSSNGNKGNHYDATTYTMDNTGPEEEGQKNGHSGVILQSYCSGWLACTECW